MLNSQMVYRWSIPVYPVDAQTAGAELEKIVERRGALKPDYVVEESRSQNAVLHNCFEWNDEAAAEKYRRRQAQDLIRNIVTIKIGKIKTPQPVRAFVNVRQDHEYVPVALVLHTPVLREAMRNSAMRELESFCRKYAVIDSLSELVTNIERMIMNYNNQ